MNDSILNKSIIDALRSAYAAPTSESITSKRAERQGVMARTQSKVSGALADTAQDTRASVEDLIGKTMDARTDRALSMEELGKLVMDATDPQEPAPVSEDPDRPFYGSGVDIEDRFPETNLSDTIADESTAPLSEVDPERRADEEFLRTGEPPAAETGEGLMSPPAQANAEPSAEEEGADTSTAFATVIKEGISTEVNETTSLTAGFDNLTEAEGTDIHLDGRGFVTLPYGIVPDKNSVKKSDGTAFDPTGSHGLKSSSLSGVDYSGATKFGISRTDYDSDQSFAKAVYAEFSSKTAAKYGNGFDNLTDEAKQAAYDMAWNAGIGSAAWASVKTMLDEASKDGEKSKDSLIGFTTNFKSGTDYPRGLLKRRLQTYNLVANENEKASNITTTASMSEGVRTGTIYTIKTTDGTVLKSWTKPSTSEALGDLTVPQ